jgi:hypothetical protein
MEFTVRESEEKRRAEEEHYGLRLVQIGIEIMGLVSFWVPLFCFMGSHPLPRLLPRLRLAAHRAASTL